MKGQSFPTASDGRDLVNGSRSLWHHFREKWLRHDGIVSAMPATPAKVLSPQNAEANDSLSNMPSDRR